MFDSTERNQAKIKFHLQQDTPTEHKGKLSPARNFALIALTILGLSVLYPAPLMASASQQNVPTPTTQQQNSSVEQTQQIKGQKRVNEQIESLKNEVEQFGGEMDEEVLSDKLLLIKVLENIEPETMDKYADNLNIIPVKTDNYSLLIANADVIYCQNGNEDVTAKLKKGEENARKEIENLLTQFTADGTPKTELQKGMDRYAAETIFDCALAEWQFRNLFEYRDKSVNSLHKLDRQYYSSQQKQLENFIERILYFLSDVASKGCSVENLSSKDEILIIINKNYCLQYFVLVDGKWFDETELMQRQLDDAFAYESLPNEQTISF